MALDPILWAMKDAPVRDAGERMILMVLAEHADEDGCNAFPSISTLARYALCSTRNVQLKLRALADRGLIVEGDQRYPALLKLPHYKRPTNYDLAIPYSWFSNPDRINQFREGRGRDPITPEDRPDLADAPTRKERSDKGTPRKNRSDEPESDGAEMEADVKVRPREYYSGGESSSPVPQIRPVNPATEGGESDDKEGVNDIHPNLPSNSPQDPPPSQGALPLEAAAPAVAASSPKGEPTDGDDRKRGTRIPQPFHVTQEMVEWARERCPDVDGRTETENFEDYWLGISGQRGLKRDWVATWRKWMRTAQQRIEQRRAEQAARQGRPFKSRDVWGEMPSNPQGSLPGVDAPIDPGWFDEDDEPGGVA